MRLTWRGRLPERWLTVTGSMRRGKMWSRDAGEKAFEMNCSDSRPTEWIYLIPLLAYLNVAKKINLTKCIFYTILIRYTFSESCHVWGKRNVYRLVQIHYRANKEGSCTEITGKKVAMSAQAQTNTWEMFSAHTQRTSSLCAVFVKPWSLLSSQEAENWSNVDCQWFIWQWVFNPSPWAPARPSAFHTPSWPALFQPVRLHTFSWTTHDGSSIGKKTGASYQLGFYKQEWGGVTKCFHQGWNVTSIVVFSISVSVDQTHCGLFKNEIK